MGGGMRLLTVRNRDHGKRMSIMAEILMPLTELCRYPL